MESELTICIATMERPGYINRALSFYKEVNFKGKILIGDSSTGKNRNEVEEVIKKFKPDLDIYLGHYSKEKFANDALVHKELCKKIKTKYTVSCGDDDFLIPSGLVECAKFLESEEGKHFSSCHGLRLIFSLTSDKKDFKRLHMLNIPSWEYPNPLDRWVSYLRNGISTQQYVHRTEIWKETYEDVDKVLVKYLGPEVLPCSITTISGMTKGYNDIITCIFQRNDDRFLNFDKTSLYSIMINNGWSNGAGKLQEIISDKFASVGVPPIYAKEVVERELWYHYLSILHNQYVRKYIGKEQVESEDKDENTISLLNKLNSNKNTQPGRAFEQVSKTLFG